MRRVLIVDDSDTLLTVVTSLLEEAGWKVDVARDGEAGAAKAFYLRPDAVVADLWMPGLNGVMLCRLLHEDPTTTHIPVILLSAAADRRSRFWAKRSGARDFLKKENVRDLPKALAAIVPENDEQPPPSAPAEGAESVRADSVTRRLGTLLDRALFDSVFVGEVQSLALTSDTFAKLFQGLAELLGEVVPYRWVGLQIEKARGIPDPAGVDPSIVAEVVRTFAGSKRGVMVAAGTASGRSASVASAQIEDKGESLGQLAVGLGAKAPSSDEKALIDLVAKTLVLPIKLVTLLVETNYMACTDVMTGLFNRRHGALVLEQTMAAARRTKTPLSIGLIDIDHFKKVNDDHGHPVGDEAIRHVAGLLASTARKSDIVARWGGEEFLVIFHGTAAPGHRIAGERYRLRVSASPLDVTSPPSTGTRLPLTISVGIAAYTEQSTEDLLAAADRALYRAKERGRNRVEVEE